MLQIMGSQTVGHDLMAEEQHIFKYLLLHTNRERCTSLTVFKKKHNLCKYFSFWK